MRNIFAIIIGYFAFGFLLEAITFGILWIYTVLPFGTILSGIICLLIFLVLLEIISIWDSMILMMVAKARWSFVIASILAICDAIYHAYQFCVIWWYVMPITACVIQFIYWIVTSGKLPITEEVDVIEKLAKFDENSTYLVALKAAKAKSMKNLRTGTIMALVAIILSIILAIVITNWTYT